MPEPLSTRSRRLLRLAATGLTTPEGEDIVEHLSRKYGMPAAQVRRYLSDAIEELGSTSRLDAVIKAVRWGLIDLPR